MTRVFFCQNSVNLFLCIANCCEFECEIAILLRKELFKQMRFFLSESTGLPVGHNIQILSVLICLARVQILVPSYGFCVMRICDISRFLRRILRSSTGMHSLALHQHRKCGPDERKKSGRLGTRDSLPGKKKGLKLHGIYKIAERQRCYNPGNDTVRTNKVKLAPTAEWRGSQENQGSLFSLTSNPWQL